MVSLHRTKRDVTYSRSSARNRLTCDDDEIAALVSLVALINAANRLAVIVHQQGGSYEPGMFAATFN